jgi:ornithine carbamoyltransferase
MTINHFLTLSDCSVDDLHYLIDRAIDLKKKQKQGISHTPLQNKILGMVFEKSSTRTRLSFEAGMIQLGGNAIFLSPRDTQLGRGEPIEDTTRVLCRMVDLIMIRTFAHQVVETVAQYSTVPVINGLTDSSHPCQLLADIQTFVEARGSIQGKEVAWIGDGNNMCNTYIEAATLFDFNLNIAAPEGFTPDPNIVATAGDRVKLFDHPLDAAQNAHLVVTDVWASMGQEAEQKEREIAFAGYQVTEETMRVAASDAIFLHCLPAHRGEEVATEVIDGPQSKVWDEAENRLHAQKALMEYLLCGRQEF